MLTMINQPAISTVREAQPADGGAYWNVREAWLLDNRADLEWLAQVGTDVVSQPLEV